ncbi:MAG: hypothetical protein LBB23_04860 [Rickettsiales bacterium]|nr:hypothetical protein [Rickettsiales bacterium]
MTQFKKGEYSSAAQIMKAGLTEQPGKEDYLYGLQCGAAYFWADKQESAQMCFAAADSEKGGYKPLAYERIMLKSSEGEAYLASGDAFARQSFNQAYALQQQSVDEASKQIDELEKEFKKSAKKVKGMPPLSKIVADVERDFDKISAVKAYADFVNPYTTWLSAIYTGLNGDTTNAENYLNRVKIFAPDNKWVSSDLSAIKSDKNHIWIVLEDGMIGKRTIRNLAPSSLRKWNINVSVPDVAPGRAGVKKIQVKGAETLLLADMTRIAKTDLSKTRRRDIIASVSFEIGKVAVAGTALIGGEMAAWNKAGKNEPGAAILLSLAGRITAAAVMSADLDWETRNWGALPNTISVARIEMPKSRKLTIAEQEIEISDDITNAVIFVRIPTRDAKPGVIVGKLN